MKRSLFLSALLVFWSVLLSIWPNRTSQAIGVAIDQNVTTKQTQSRTSVDSPRFSTAQPNELLLAFVAADGPGNSTQSISSVTGGGLTWSLRQRTNAQPGTAEIWQAVATNKLTNVKITAHIGNGSYQAMITVVSFTDTDLNQNGATASANAASGAAQTTLTTTRNDAWVWGIGSDWDNATARTVGSDQIKVSEYLTSKGNTIWTKRHIRT